MADPVEVEAAPTTALRASTVLIVHNHDEIEHKNFIKT